MTVSRMSFLNRLWLAWVCAFRILFDGEFAAKAALLGEAAPEPTLPREDPASRPVPAPDEGALAARGALQLLSLLQREGRFVDFVQQDVSAFSDADVGAAARVVHEGCRRVISAHARVVSVRGEAEGAQLVLEHASEDVKLVGNVAGSAPFRGVLRHRGWRVQNLTLPQLMGARDPQLVAPAELELS